MKRPDANWKHELGSIAMFEYMLDDNNIDMDKTDRQMVEDLILGKCPEYA